MSLSCKIAFKFSKQIFVILLLFSLPLPTIRNCFLFHLYFIYYVKTKKNNFITVFIYLFVCKLINLRLENLINIWDMFKSCNTIITNSWSKQYLCCLVHTFSSSNSGLNGIKSASTSVSSTSSKLAGFHFGFCNKKHTHE